MGPSSEGGPKTESWDPVDSSLSPRLGAKAYSRDSNRTAILGFRESDWIFLSDARCCFDNLLGSVVRFRLSVLGKGSERGCDGLTLLEALSDPALNRSRSSARSSSTELYVLVSLPVVSFATSRAMVDPSTAPRCSSRWEMNVHSFRHVSVLALRSMTFWRITDRISRMSPNRSSKFLVSIYCEIKAVTAISSIGANVLTR